MPQATQNGNKWIQWAWPIIYISVAFFGSYAAFDSRLRADEIEVAKCKATIQHVSEQLVEIKDSVRDLGQRLRDGQEVWQEMREQLAVLRSWQLSGGAQ